MRELVMKELEHRGRNTYAVIDVIVQKRRMIPNERT
jgi:hypothetical protein